MNGENHAEEMPLRHVFLELSINRRCGGVSRRLQSCVRGL